MRNSVKKDIYFSFYSLYKVNKYLGLLFMSFDRKRRAFYLTKKDNLISIIITLIVAALEVGIFVRKIIFLETNTLFLNIMSLLENSFSVVVSYFNFYLYKTKCITVFENIHKFDLRVNYKFSHNYKMKRYKIISVLTIFAYVSVDLLCLLFKMFPLEIMHVVIISYITIIINTAIRFIFIFLVTEIESRFIYVGSSKNPRLYKHFGALIEISKVIRNIYNFPLILNAAKICISLTISLSHSFFRINKSNSDYISLFITTFWLLVGTFDIGVILFFCQSFYKTVSNYFI